MGQRRPRVLWKHGHFLAAHGSAITGQSISYEVDIDGQGNGLPPGHGWPTLGQQYLQHGASCCPDELGQEDVEFIANRRGTCPSAGLFGFLGNMVYRIAGERLMEKPTFAIKEGDEFAAGGAHSTCEACGQGAGRVKRGRFKAP